MCSLSEWKVLVMGVGWWGCSCNMSYHRNCEKQREKSSHLCFPLCHDKSQRYGHFLCASREPLYYFVGKNKVSRIEMLHVIQWSYNAFCLFCISLWFKNMFTFSYLEIWKVYVIIGYL